MTAQEIEKYFETLNDELDQTGVKGAFQLSCAESLRAGTRTFFAMKTPASRVESKDKQDILFLIDLLDLKTADEFSTIPEKYYPRR